MFTVEKRTGTGLETFNSLFTVGKRTGTRPETFTFVRRYISSGFGRVQVFTESKSSIIVPVTYNAIMRLFQQTVLHGTPCAVNIAPRGTVTAVLVLVLFFSTRPTRTTTTAAVAAVTFPRNRFITTRGHTEY